MLKERVVGPHGDGDVEGHDGVELQLHGLELPLVHALVAVPQPHHPDVGQLVGYHTHGLAAEVFLLLDVQPVLHILLVEIGADVGDKGETAGDHGQRLIGGRPLPVQKTVQELQLLFNGRDVGQENASVGRDLDSLGGADENFVTQFIFQVADRGREHGL